MNTQWEREKGGRKEGMGIIFLMATKRFHRICIERRISLLGSS
jgi:hypothetical protein